MQERKDTTKRRQAYRLVEGLYLSHYFAEGRVRSALAYKPQPEDVFIVSYPKCGTTWLQYLVFTIFSGGVPPVDKADFWEKTSFLELCGSEGVGSRPRPDSIKTHLPFHKQPYSKRAKYLYVTRNPYDCCVSYFYHTKSSPAYVFLDGVFDEFFDMFLEGKVEYGDYFDHVLSWYDHRHDANVLFLTYEDLKRDTKGQVLKIAKFLGKDYGQRLQCDPGIVEKILNVSSTERMKEVLNNYEFNGPVQQPSATSAVKHITSGEVREESLEVLSKRPFISNFVRKGVIGDWRNHFSEEQEARMKNWITLRTEGNDVMRLWINENLP